MDKFTVKITFRSGKHKTITDVCKLSYAEEFVNNKWKLMLDIGKNIDSDPEYISYRSNIIDKILILHDERIDVHKDKNYVCNQTINYPEE